MANSILAGWYDLIWPKPSIDWIVDCTDFYWPEAITIGCEY